MGKSAARLKMAAVPDGTFGARVIDIRTRRPWRPPPAPEFHWPFLADVAITVFMVALGAWLFLKMRGG
jgi:hypothetical protein